MSRNELEHEIARSRVLRGQLRADVNHQKRLSADIRRIAKQSTATRKRLAPQSGRITLLLMAEHLIAAHKAAKVDEDGYTLTLIEDAMFHVGQRLAREA